MSAPRRPRLKVEECIDLNADQMRREGVLTPRTRSTLSSYWNEELALVMRLEATPRWLFIDPEPRSGTRPLERQAIELDSIGCNYGGRRTFFLCPGDGCGRRCVSLFLVNGLFRCRACHGLLYASQTKDKWGRLLWQANKVREGLSGEPGTSQPIADRPRGMWRRTYRRRRDSIHEFERMAWTHLLKSRGHGHLFAQRVDP